jgi:hypothetical protein
MKPTNSTSISECCSNALPMAVAASSLIVLPSRRSAFNVGHRCIASHSSLTRIDFVYISLLARCAYRQPHYCLLDRDEPTRVHVQLIEHFSIDYRSCSISTIIFTRSPQTMFLSFLFFSLSLCLSLSTSPTSNPSRIHRRLSVLCFDRIIDQSQSNYSKVNDRDRCDIIPFIQVMFIVTIDQIRHTHSTLVQNIDPKREKNT